ncbi:(2Fe-2S)-binding protein [Nocardioides sp. Soil797]|nr:(2Fe-2S)-binding protein [Nocardioides sp. Soil797]
MSSLDRLPTLVHLTRRLEDAEALDGAVHALEPHVRNLFASGARGAVLRGDWLGHALHPAMTDLVLGSWTSATVLDVVGRGRWSEAAQTLVGTGLVAFGPTAWTGWAQWSETGPRDKRVGLVHAVTNGVAVGLYASSYVARRKGNQASGTGLALLGAAVAKAGAYLGGHLATSRNVGTHHPEFDATTT